MKTQKKKYILHPKVIKSYHENPDLLRIHLTPEYTKVDFGYVAKDIYINGGWIRIAPETFIENTITKQRYTLVNAENIPLAPMHHYFETKKDWRYFSLFFPSIPQKDCIINIIEVENGTPNDFNYYNIEIKMSDCIELI
jgi:hypothetical protein